MRARRTRATLVRMIPVDTDKRTRTMGLASARLMALIVLVPALTATAAWQWTWRAHERAAQAIATSALAFVDRRLATIDLELSIMARLARLPEVLESCPEPVVAQLLEQSLQSSLVRRFDIVQVDDTLRCEPGGARQGKALDAMPPAGLSIAAGSQLGARSVVLRPLGGQAVLQATLEPHALSLPQAALPQALRALPARVDAQSPPAGALMIRDTRPRPGESGPALTATAQSATYSVGVQVQVDRSDLHEALVHQAVIAAAVALALLGVVVTWVWQLALRRSRLTHRLERALRKRQFVPHVQPIVDLASGRCVGAEILMRWRHPQRGVLAPAEFIEEAERSGLIVGMSDLVMTQAAQRLAALSQAQPALYFSFNVTPQQLRRVDFGRRLAEIFVPETIARDKVLLELTEREFIDAGTSDALAQLQAGGWRVAIDDFGTGHSSLAALEKLSIHRIKIDRAFVRTIDEGTVNRPVLDAIIALAAQIGVPLIAEGVETPSQWDYLAARGVRHAQGYLMARPMPIDDFEAWLAGRGDVPSGTAAPLQAATMTEQQAQALWHRMRQPGGVSVRDRRYRLRVYRQCFIGREAVDWIAEHTGASRAEAVRIGRTLLAQDRVRHVVREHDFEDAELYYHFVEPTTEAQDEAPVDDLRRMLRGPDSVAWRTRARGLLCFRQCATGREIVDWIATHRSVPRHTARRWATQLMRAGALRHVFDDRPFRDDRTLYRAN